MMKVLYSGRGETKLSLFQIIKQSRIYIVTTESSHLISLLFDSNDKTQMNGIPTIVLDEYSSYALPK